MTNKIIPKDTEHLKSRIEEIINAVDRKIRLERIYLQKKHKNGLFDFQNVGISFEPYNVEHERIIYPLVEKMTVDEFHLSEDILDIYLLKEYNIEKLHKNYFNTGVLGRTILLDKEGTFVLTEYYKNIQPQNYTFKLHIPEENKLDALNRLSYSIDKVFINKNHEKELHMNVHFHEQLRQDMKRLNPDLTFNRNTCLVLKKEIKKLVWKDIETNIKNLISRLDDTCVNIFNRVDYINYLTENVDEIKNTIDHLNDTEKQTFKEYYLQNKDWFGLIFEAIDLTNNKIYQHLLNNEQNKIQAKKVEDVMNYLVYHIVLDNKVVETVKRKI